MDVSNHDLARIVAHLGAKVQKLSKRIDELEAEAAKVQKLSKRIDQLEAEAAKVQKLSKRIDQLEAEAAKVQKLSKRIDQLEAEAAKSDCDAPLIVTPHAAVPPPAPAVETEAPAADQSPGSIAGILKAVASEYGVTVKDLLGPSRLAQYVYPRHEVFLRGYEAGHSVTKLGRYLGRDHSTVICGAKAARTRREEERAT